MENDPETACELRQTEVLPGLTLTVCPTDRFKVGYLSVKLLLPADRSVAALRALTLEILRRGTERYPAMADINRRLDELYATPFRFLNGYTNRYQYVGFAAELLDEDYLLDDTDLVGGVLEVMTQMLYHPALDADGNFPAKTVDAEKKNMVDLLRSAANQPATYAMMRFLDAFYGDGPFATARALAEDDLWSIERPELGKLWREWIRRVPIRCFYVGKMPAERLTDALRARFGAEMRTVGFCPEVLPVSDHTVVSESIRGGEVLHVEEEREVGQSQLIIGCHTGVTVDSPDFYAMMLAHEIFGVSPVSRLFMHVREERGLCYDCSSDYYIDRGDIIVSCGIRADRREEAERAILEQIEVMKTGAFSDAELDAARKSLDSGYRLVKDSTKSLANYYALRQLLGVRETVDECRAHFFAVSREDVVRAAGRILPDTVYFLRGNGHSSDDADGEAGD